jgi:cytidylate kinase
MIVTIDGPAGAGKSSAARALAQRLGFRFLDTGAMYRAVTLAAVERGVDLEDARALAELAGVLDIQVTDDRVFLDGRDVTGAIRTLEITTLTRHAADNPGVRARLVQLQRAAADGVDVVTEGRDQSSVVFPDAECKIFLTADETERARRRHGDLLARGEKISFDEVLAGQRRRDERDGSREVGALRKTPDAIEFSTNSMSPEDVVDRLYEIVQLRKERRMP